MSILTSGIARFVGNVTAVAACIFSLIPHSSYAQLSTATVTGIVRDSSGAS